jgi:putative DNA methylase
VVQYLGSTSHPDYPLSVYYAFKQEEADEDGGDHESGPNLTASTGWETMLAGLIAAGFATTGTWPMRTERGVRTRSLGSNALASSIVLVCRPRRQNARLATRREFLYSICERKKWADEALAYNSLVIAWPELSKLA